MAMEDVGVSLRIATDPWPTFGGNDGGMSVELLNASFIPPTMKILVDLNPQGQSFKHSPPLTLKGRGAGVVKL